MAQFRVDSRLYIIFSVLLFVVPLTWMIAWILAVLVHELCHYIAVKLLGGSIYKFSLGLGGADLVCSGLTGFAYIVAVMAGPVGGIALTLVGKWFPQLAICSWMLSIYNLLPILPLDGGRIVNSLVKNERLYAAFERVALIILSLLTLICSLYSKLGPLLLIIIVTLLIKKRKRPCKETDCAVQ